MRELDIVGKTLAEVSAILNDQSTSFRITRRDDKHYVVTMDVRPDRVNLEIDGGVVTAYRYG